MDTNCYCVGKHVPLPLKTTMIHVYGGPVWLCPTTEENLWKLYEEWKVRGERPPGSVRKHYSDYVQKLVEGLVNDDTSREV